MFRIILIILYSIIFFSCNQDNSLKQKELELKEKELELREKELAQKESTYNNQEKKNESLKSSQEVVKQKRKMRFLFYSNGGLVGYFDDGTVSGCPKCNLIEENVKVLYSAKSYETYTVEDDGSLLVGKTKREYPSKKESGLSGWAMIDYVWLVEVK